MCGVPTWLLPHCLVPGAFGHQHFSIPAAADADKQSLVAHAENSTDPTEACWCVIAAYACTTEATEVA